MYSNVHPVLPANLWCCLLQYEDVISLMIISPEAPSRLFLQVCLRENSINVLFLKSGQAVPLYKLADAESSGKFGGQF